MIRFLSLVAVICAVSNVHEAKAQRPEIVWTIAPPPSTVTVPPADYVMPETLRGASIYVYSFLDVRKRDFGPRTIDAFDNQLTARLAASAVHVKLLRFENTGAGHRFRPGHMYRDTYYGDGLHGEDMLPVVDVVRENQDDEAQSAAQYRLIVLPTDYYRNEQKKYYTIDWFLVDVKTGQTIWQYQYIGHHAAIISTGGGADIAGKFVDSVMAAFSEKHLL